MRLLLQVVPDLHLSFFAKPIRPLAEYYEEKNI